MAKQAPLKNRDSRKEKARRRHEQVDTIGQSAVSSRHAESRRHSFFQPSFLQGMGSVFDLYGASATRGQPLISDQPDYSGLFADYQAIFRDALSARARLLMEVERYAS